MREHTDFPAKANILVVDDTPENLLLLTDLLGHEGYAVRPASDGEFAIQSAQANPADLILLDVKMPGLNGYEVCQQLKADERTRDIPIIFISALSDTEDKVQGFEAGGVDYITKPFQAKEVLARIQTHVTIHALQRELRQEITRRREAEEEMRVLNQQLHEANTSKDTFFSIIAHDLRNPFTVLIGLTEVLTEEFDRFDKDHIKTMLSRLHASAKNLYALLTNLLDWSRLQRGVMKYRPESIFLQSLAAHSVLAASVTAGHKDLRIINQIPPDLTVYADPAMLNTVLRNLLSNAVKFTPPGGIIELSVQPHERTVEIMVADTGIGMSPVIVEKLFHIEHSTHRNGTAGEEGTGLGLILCQELVHKNGGTLRVESEVGKGSRFIVALPAARL